MTHMSFVVSTLHCLKHDHVVVHLFESKLYKFLSSELEDLTKV
jgi:hypothetical protein